MQREHPRDDREDQVQQGQRRQRAVPGVSVERGNMLYSAVIQPPATLCSFIHRGTVSSTVTPQITRVLPHSMRVEPVA